MTSLKLRLDSGSGYSGRIRKLATHDHGCHHQIFFKISRTSSPFLHLHVVSFSKIELYSSLFLYLVCVFLYSCCQATLRSQIFSLQSSKSPNPLFQASPSEKIGKKSSRNPPNQELQISFLIAKNRHESRDLLPKKILLMHD